MPSCNKTEETRPIRRFAVRRRTYHMLRPRLRRIGPFPAFISADTMKQLRPTRLRHVSPPRIISARAGFVVWVLAVLLSLFSLQANAQQPGSHQDHAQIRATVEQFLQAQSAGMGGKASVIVGAIDARRKLPACAALEAYLPSGSRAWGRTTVGVRCNAPSAWNIYLAATVGVQAEYIVTAAPLAQGQTIGPDDIIKVQGELTTLPAGIITDPSQAVGRTLSISLPPGAPLRQDSLRNQLAIQQGQQVRVVASGPGFKISTEARALNNANEGQVTQVRTANGQMVSGMARMGGIVEVMN
jgi:flagella basal body P-ring formation protein FlgA